MTNEYLLVDVENGVMKITFNRPDSLNALNSDMMSGMLDALKEAKRNLDIRVVTLQGAGRAFSAGGDVKDMGRHAGTNVYFDLARTNELIMAIRTLEKPVIAIVHGYAAGVAFCWALASDLIFAAEDSKFIMSFSKLGFNSDGGGSYFLPRLVGAQRAKEILFFGEPIDAKQAYDWGIVNRIYKVDELQNQAMTFVNTLANGPTKSYEMTKKLVHQSFVSDLDEIMELERLSQVIMIQTNDHKEGVNAFIGKRKPKFKGN